MQMKRIAFLSTACLITYMGVTSFKPSLGNKPMDALGDSSKTNKTVFVNPYTTYFGCNDTPSTITKASFLRLMETPLCVRDKDNKQYRVKNFQILYAERGLYLDSNDAPLIVTDYTEEKFTGDTINTLWKGILKSRLFKGDTVLIDNVTFIKDGKNYRGRSLKMAVVE